MYRVELAKAFHRWRTWLLAAAIGGIPVIIVFALKVSPPAPGGAEDAPPFLFQIASNGLFAALTALAVVQPFFLPLATGSVRRGRDRRRGAVGDAALPAVAPRASLAADPREVRVVDDAAGRASSRSRSSPGIGGGRGRVRARAAAHPVGHHLVGGCVAPAYRGIRALHARGVVGDRVHRSVHLDEDRFGTRERRWPRS